MVLLTFRHISERLQIAEKQQCDVLPVKRIQWDVNLALKYEVKCEQVQKSEFQSFWKDHSISLQGRKEIAIWLSDVFLWWLNKIAQSLLFDLLSDLGAEVYKRYRDTEHQSQKSHFKMGLDKWGHQQCLQWTSVFASVECSRKLPEEKIQWDYQMAFWILIGLLRLTTLPN